jgi:hypothetical protein
MTPREEEILRLLCFAVRFFSLEQVARTWWSGQPREIRRARQRMRTLARNGWERPLTILARPLLKMDAPVFEWHLDGQDPDIAAVSRALRNRWKEPARDVEIFLATPRATAVMGGGALGSVRNLCQTTHDLHVSQVFLFYRENRPDQASLWVGEDSVIPLNEHEKRPDAVLLNEAKEILRVIEFGGAYKADRVQAVHDFCWQRNLPYELW